MKITIHTFAAVKEHFGQQFELEAEGLHSVKDVRDELSRQRPNAAKLLHNCRFAVNDIFVNDSTELHDHAALYIVPPSSGG